MKPPLTSDGPRAGTKRRWLVSAIGAALSLGLLFALFRMPTTTPVPGDALGKRPSANITTGRSDELALRDLAPLFLPTSYNAQPVQKPQRQPMLAVFDADASRLRFDENAPAVTMPPPFRAPATPTEILADNPGPLASGIGRTDVKPPALPGRAAFLEVFAPETGEAVLSRVLDQSAAPQVAARERTPWRPIEFRVTVDREGVVGQLMLTSGSGSDEVDNHFRNYLARTFRIGDRLTPGFYRIVVGP